MHTQLFKVTIFSVAFVMFGQKKVVNKYAVEIWFKKVIVLLFVLNVASLLTIELITYSILELENPLRKLIFQLIISFFEFDR